MSQSDQRVAEKRSKKDTKYHEISVIVVVWVNTHKQSCYVISDARSKRQSLGNFVAARSVFFVI